MKQEANEIAESYDRLESGFSRGNDETLDLRAIG